MAFKAVERRILEISKRGGLTQDQPRKKRRREEEEEECLRELGRRIEEHRAVRASFVDDARTQRKSTFLAKILANWVHNPSCRRVASAQLGRRRSAPEISEALPRSPSRFPQIKSEDFVNFETLKTFVNGERRGGRRFGVNDGDSLAWTRRSLGDAVEIGVGKEDESRSADAEETASCASSFDLIGSGFASMEDLHEEKIFPIVHPDLSPFQLKIPFAPSLPSAMEDKESDRHSDSSSFCRLELPASFQENRQAVPVGDRAKSEIMEYRSQATTEVEIDLSTRYDDVFSQNATEKNSRNCRDRISRWMRRALTKNEEGNTESGPDSFLRNQYCALPLDRLSPDAGKRRDQVLSLAYVDAVLNEGGAFGLVGAPSLEAHPFVCEGKRVRLCGDDGFQRTFVVTPKFDLTMGEYLQQNGDASADVRISLFLQCLETVAHLHSKGLVHGSIKPDSFLVDIDNQAGGHRALLSNFKKASPYTEDLAQFDAWNLGRLGLRLFDDDLRDDDLDLSSPATSATKVSRSSSVNDVPVLGDDAPLEMDILVHRLMSSDPEQRISVGVAANMMQLYFWRREFYPPSTSPSSNNNNNNDLRSTASSPTAPIAFQSEAYEAAKRGASRSFLRLQSRGEEDNDDNNNDEFGSSVTADLRRCLFGRASLQDLVFADDAWKKSREDLYSFVSSKDMDDLRLYVAKPSI